MKTDEIKKREDYNKNIDTNDTAHNINRARQKALTALKIAKEQEASTPHKVVRIDHKTWVYKKLES